MGTKQPQKKRKSWYTKLTPEQKVERQRRRHAIILRKRIENIALELKKIGYTAEIICFKATEE